MKYALLLIALIASVHGRYSPYRRRVFGADDPKDPRQPDKDEDSDSAPEGDRDCASYDEKCPKDKYPYLPTCGYWPKEGKWYTFVNKCYMEGWNACFLTEFVSIGEFECNSLSYEYRYRFWEYDMQGNRLSDEEIKKIPDLGNTDKTHYSPNDRRNKRRNYRSGK